MKLNNPNYFFSDYADDVLTNVFANKKNKIYIIQLFNFYNILCELIDDDNDSSTIAILPRRD